MQYSAGIFDSRFCHFHWDLYFLLVSFPCGRIDTDSVTEIDKGDPFLFLQIPEANHHTTWKTEKV